MCEVLMDEYYYRAIRNTQVPEADGTEYLVSILTFDTVFEVTDLIALLQVEAIRMMGEDT